MGSLNRITLWLGKIRQQIEFKYGLTSGEKDNLSVFSGKRFVVAAENSRIRQALFEVLPKIGAKILDKKEIGEKSTYWLIGSGEKECSDGSIQIKVTYIFGGYRTVWRVCQYSVNSGKPYRLALAVASCINGMIMKRIKIF